MVLRMRGCGVLLGLLLFVAAAGDAGGAAECFKARTVTLVSAQALWLLRKLWNGLICLSKPGLVSRGSCLLPMKPYCPPTFPLCCRCMPGPPSAQQS
jgi:hypothetical protein